MSEQRAWSARARSAAAARPRRRAARLAYSALNRRPPGGAKTWSRTNHRGEPVTLLEGPAVAAGAIAGVLAQAACGPRAPVGPDRAKGSSLRTDRR